MDWIKTDRGLKSGTFLTKFLNFRTIILKNF